MDVKVRKATELHNTLADLRTAKADAEECGQHYEQVKKTKPHIPKFIHKI